MRAAAAGAGRRPVGAAGARGSSPLRRAARHCAIPGSRRDSGPLHSVSDSVIHSVFETAARPGPQVVLAGAMEDWPAHRDQPGPVRSERFRTGQRGSQQSGPVLNRPELPRRARPRGAGQRRATCGGWRARARCRCAAGRVHEFYPLAARRSNFVCAKKLAQNTHLSPRRGGRHHRPMQTLVTPHL
jgi:hypothetical protein